MSLDVTEVAVRFGGVVALDGVSLSFPAGVVTGVIGPNGSGKSTLFNAIVGFVKPSHGSVSMDGRSLDGLPPHRRLTVGGIARTLQTPRSDPDMTLEDTVRCGFFTGTARGFVRSLVRSPAVHRAEERSRAGADALVEELGLVEHRTQAVGDLPLGLVRLTDVARAIAANPKYLLLDEPAAGLSPAERSHLGSEIRRLAAEGVGVVLIEHDFDVISNATDHVYVLHQGSMIAEGPAKTLRDDPTVVDAYLGRR